MERARLKIDDQILHTGQHYDDIMSKIFFDELNIRPPDVNLAVGSGPQGKQTARMLEAIEAYLETHPTDMVIVYGDTNSTLAGTLAAAKLHIPVAHVEAGLRSFNRRMPEELNRIATDHLSDVLFAPTATATANLAAEGLEARSHLSGDVMYDAALYYADEARRRSEVWTRLGVREGGYGLATLHRAENTDPKQLLELLEQLNAAATRFGPLIFPIHPRTSAIVQRDGLRWSPAANLTVIPPVGYLDMLKLLQGANWVLTDSGGLQKEAFFLGCPCVTLRNETEWVETLEGGANFVAGNDGSKLMERLDMLTGGARRRDFSAVSPTSGPFGAGNASDLIVESICTFHEQHHD
jgi:UDP-GlcNAc3NAcA epimerase